MYCSPNIINWVDEIKKNVTGRTYSTHGGCGDDFSRKTLKGRNSFGDRGVDDMIILNWI
jgi:hypothetical protein